MVPGVVHGSALAASPTKGPVATHTPLAAQIRVFFWLSNPKTKPGLGVQGVPPTTFCATFGTQLGEWHEVADAGPASGIATLSSPDATIDPMRTLRIYAS
ncbi:hypothetical protein MAIC_28960 [Mycolicibacterium aichiense]|uniref:Uncharacterized protein n=1 Tax=Mycolicibacterium aichiense TaxID=1799 RepID=A0AAD1HPG0_9MYCO|nr:hypothetical protein MAIC_28960 [Mycolicibacterium aichiense]